MTELLLYASEVSGCIGMNPYKSSAECALKIWERIDYDTYAACYNRTRPPVEITPEQFIEENPNVHEDLNKIVETTDFENVDTLFEESVKKYELTDEEIIKGLRSYVYTNRGKKGESPALDRYQKRISKNIVDRNRKFYKARMEYAPGKTLLLGGRVDGLTEDGELVEIKNRQRRIFDKIPDYEMIQIHIYMFLVGLQCCHFVQSYGGEEKSEMIDFDVTFWDTLKHKIFTFARRMDVLLCTETVQDNLMRFHVFEGVDNSQSESTQNNAETASDDKNSE